PYQLTTPLLAVRQRTDTHRPHHLVVLVRNYVAVPDKETGDVELGLHAGNHTRIDEDGVLGPGFPGLGPGNSAGDELRSSIRRDINRLAVDYFELRLMNVNRVGVLGEIVDLPGLGGAECRVLGDWVHPLLRCGRNDTLDYARRAEQRLDRRKGDSGRIIRSIDYAPVRIKHHLDGLGLGLVERHGAGLAGRTELGPGRQR